MSLFDFCGLLLHGLLGFHGPHGIRQQGIRAGCPHGQAPRLGPRSFALQCGKLTENLQIPRRSPHERGKVPAVVAVTTVTAGTAAVVAAAATAVVDAIEISPPGGDRWCRGVAFRTLAAPATSSAVGASRVAGGTVGYTSVMLSRSDSLPKSSILPSP